MGQIGISVTKRTAFRSSTQEFTNTYHYGSIGLNPDAALANTLIDAVVAVERDLHSTLVSFIHARCWSSGGTQAENQMIFEKDLTGTGTQLLITDMDRERAVLVQWPAGTDSRGRPVYLRKWYHSCGQCAAGTFGQTILENTAPIVQAVRDLIVAKVNNLTRIPSGVNTWGLKAESGRERSGGLLSADPPAVHPFLEHHQLGDMWRG